MGDISFTDQQRQAIHALGRSVIVSAAAGSGKTAVLAERCAHLVSEAPPPYRCDVDELLVLTFTEAAATEMRSRIAARIRRRSAERPDDDRLRRQAALIDAAHISTIHGFCFWLVRRWFSHVGIDPGATVLDAEESRLVRGEALQSVFEELYREESSGGPLLGEPEESTAGRSGGSPPRLAGLGAAFARLVRDYGLGDDREIARFLLKLHEFARSLPDPEVWFREALDTAGARPERLLARMVRELRRELAWQAEHCEKLAASVDHPAREVRYYADAIRAYAGLLGEWLGDAAGSGCGEAGGDPVRWFEGLRQKVLAFEFDRKGAPRLSKDADPELRTARDAASELLQGVKAKLFGERLRDRFFLFSPAEYLEGMARTAPYAATVVELVRRFDGRYGEHKRRLNVLDFADLERFALDLLREGGETNRPSDVARSMQDRFGHVLVDEFQDINPLQQSILRLVSRESAPGREGNLFVVGDVKQSIYRFRQAEPALFIERLTRFREGRDGGAALFLQSNFRSRGPILEAVNLVFRALMRDAGSGVVYDDDAELRPARPDGAPAPRSSVDVYLLERNLRAGEADADGEDAPAEGVADGGEEAESDVAGGNDASRWSVAEREAYLIGELIRGWMERDEVRIDDRPMSFRDVAILLRAARQTAERMAAMLARRGVPAFAEAGGSLFDAREVRDVLAALAVLDNPRQDISLASVLRSGIFGTALTAEELVRIRCHRRDVAFHEAVFGFAASGSHDELVGRVEELLRRIDRFRHAARRRPVAELLWKVYEDHGFLAYSGGLPNGGQRRANLLRLHDIARKFATFRRQGLHRFLRFVQSLKEGEQGPSAAPAIGEAEDVVRIMTIHQAKGLEFPVVFVAGLGTEFHLGDRRGRILFERESHFGFRVVEPERLIEYPSLGHRLVVSDVERTAREEELRLLYVAMTRAREKLVLVGSRRGVSKENGRGMVGRRVLSGLSVATARTALDWILPVLSTAPAEVARGLGGRSASESPLFDVHVVGADKLAGWSMDPKDEEEDEVVRQAVAHLEPLPSGEPIAVDDAVVEEVRARLDRSYIHRAAATVRAAIGASEFKGEFDFTRNPEERAEVRAAVEPEKEPRPGRGTREDAARRGTVIHRVLQRLDYSTARNADGVASELQRLVGEGVLGDEDRPLVDVDGLAWFAGTPLADEIRRAGAGYRREFSYVAAEPLGFFDSTVAFDPTDFSLVRGIVDGVIVHDDCLEIVDFKTDAVGRTGVAERTEHYRPQMELYARAMSRLWKRPVTACRLVFLSPREIVSWPGPAMGARG